MLDGQSRAAGIVHACLSATWVREYCPEMRQLPRIYTRVWESYIRVTDRQAWEHSTMAMTAARPVERVVVDVSRWRNYCIYVAVVTSTACQRRWRALAVPVTGAAAAPTKRLDRRSVVVGGPRAAVTVGHIHKLHTGKWPQLSHSTLPTDAAILCRRCIRWYDDVLSSYMYVWRESDFWLPTISGDKYYILPRDAMLARCMPSSCVCVCLSGCVCPSQSGIVSKRLNPE